MNMKTILGSILICLFLLGCNDSIDENDGTGNLNLPEKNVQIYNKGDGSLFSGNGVVNATIYPWNRENIWIVQAGAISNGKLNFSFPSNIPNEKLESFWGEYEHPNALITPVNTKFCGTISTFRFPFIVYNSIGVKLGELKYGKIIMTDTGFIGDTVYYFYFNQNSTVSGFFSFPETNETENYQINAKKGWNRIYIHSTWVNNNGLTTFTTDSKNIPNDLKWEFE